MGVDETREGFVTQTESSLVSYHDCKMMANTADIDYTERGYIKVTLSNNGIVNPADSKRCIHVKSRASVIVILLLVFIPTHTPTFRLVHRLVNLLISVLICLLIRWLIGVLINLLVTQWHIFLRRLVSCFCFMASCQIGCDFFLPRQTTLHTSCVQDILASVLLRHASFVILHTVQCTGVVSRIFWRVSCCAMRHLWCCTLCSAQELCPGYASKCLISSKSLGDSAKGLCFGECPASPCGLVDFVSGILNAQRNKKREICLFEFWNTWCRLTTTKSESKISRKSSCSLLFEHSSKKFEFFKIEQKEERTESVKWLDRK